MPGYLLLGTTTYYTQEVTLFIGSLLLCSGCAKVGALGHGKRLHRKWVQQGQPALATHRTDVHVATALVDMYAKTGALGDALQVFSEVNRSLRPDLKLYTAMLNGYAAVLCALNTCSHAGMVEDVLCL